MKSLMVLIGCVAVSGSGLSAVRAQSNTPVPSPETLPNVPPSASASITSANRLPPSPPAVATIEWSEFLKMPVGPLGYEMTERIKALDGKRVRILGYMVKREQPITGSILLTPMPVSVEEDETGFGDLPPQTVRVLLPYASKKMIAYTSRPLLLTGIFSVGVRPEPEETVQGTVSLFRLILDEPAESIGRKTAPTKKLLSKSGSLSPKSH